MTRIDVSHDNQDIAIQEEDMEEIPSSSSSSIQKESVRPPTDLGSLSLVGSCDNLLCLVSNRVRNYYVHNLSTKEWFIVPRVWRRHRLYSCLRVFYYHPPTGEYRLLTWFRALNFSSPSGVADPKQQPSPPPTFGVFSLKLRSDWRLIDAPHCDLSRLTLGYAMFQPRATAHGSVHWAPMYNYPWILAFNLVTENFTQLDIPRRLRQERQSVASKDYHVVTLGQELVLGYTRCNSELELWLLKDYKYQEEECWVKLHTISILGIVNALSSRNRVERKYEEEFFRPVVLCGSPTCGEDLRVLRYNARVFILYDLIYKRVKWVTAKKFCGIFVALLTDTLPCRLYSFN